MRKQYELKQILSHVEKISDSENLSRNESDLLKTLLRLAAQSFWKRPFTPAEALIIDGVKVSHSTLVRCRRHLISLGLIYYKKGSRLAPSEYWFGKAVLCSEVHQTSSLVQNEQVNEQVNFKDEQVKNSPEQVNEQVNFKNEQVKNQQLPGNQSRQGISSTCSHLFKMNTYTEDNNNKNNNNTSSSISVQNEQVNFKNEQVISPLAKVIVPLFRKYFKTELNSVQKRFLSERLASFEADAAVEAMDRTRAAGAERPLPYYTAILDRWRKAGTFDLDMIKSNESHELQAQKGNNDQPNINEKPLDANWDNPIEAQIENHDIVQSQKAIELQHKLLGCYFPEEGKHKTKNYLQVTKDHQTKTYELDGDCRYFLLDKLKQRYLIKHKDNPTLLEVQILNKLDQQIAEIKKWQKEYPIEFDIVGNEFLGWRSKQKEGIKA